jgi:hypothetical protein
MAITLTWFGPLGPGNLPTDLDEIAGLDVAAVYLRVKVYQPCRVVAYVGQTTQLISRIDQHLTRLVGLTHLLRNDTGETIYDAAFDARLAAFNQLERISVALISEVERMQFYYAPCNDTFLDGYLDLIERLLKARIEDRAVRIGFTCENRNAVPLRQLPEDTDRVAVVNEIGDLGVADQEQLRLLLGEDPIEIALPELENGAP